MHIGYRNPNQSKYGYDISYHPLNEKASMLQRNDICEHERIFFIKDQQTYVLFLTLTKFMYGVGILINDIIIDYKNKEDANIKSIGLLVIPAEYTMTIAEVIFKFILIVF